MPRLPVAERGERPHRKRAAVLLLPPRVRVGVLASAGRGRLPEVPGGAAVVVLAQVGRVPRVRVPHDRLTTERNRCRPDTGHFRTLTTRTARKKRAPFYARLREPCPPTSPRARFEHPSRTGNGCGNRHPRTVRTGPQHATDGRTAPAAAPNHFTQLHTTKHLSVTSASAREPQRAATWGRAGAVPEHPAIMPPVADKPEEVRRW